MAGSQQTSLLGKWLDDEWVSEGIMTKTGGEGPFALLQERGVGRCGFPGAQPVLCRRCFTTVPNLGCLKATSGVAHPNCLRRRLGGMEPNHSSAGGEQAGPWLLARIRGTRTPADLPAPTSVQTNVS